MEALNVLDRYFDKQIAAGYTMQKNGTRLSGFLPHLAPLAVLHAIYAPLSQKTISRLQKDLAMSIPTDLKTLYEHCNGFGFYYAAITVFGSVYGQDYDINKRLPFSILNDNNPIRRPMGSPSNVLYMGSYGMDASLVGYVLDTGNIIRVTRYDYKICALWSSLSDWIEAEIPRIDEIAEQHKPFKMLGPEHLPWGTYGE